MMQLLASGLRFEPQFRPLFLSFAFFNFYPLSVMCDESGHTKFPFRILTT